MTFRSFMATLVITGALIAGLSQDKPEVSEQLKVEEYTFDPIYINVSSEFHDAGLD